mmetsp:Transcript_16447/g.21583  ORF Transcript_16447/g.21583 Transcript_16447/m.21583 type:complete len:521 (+) Transcript_16447:456-2018(+)
MLGEENFQFSVRQEFLAYGLLQLGGSSERLAGNAVRSIRKVLGETQAVYYNESKYRSLAQQFRAIDSSKKVIVFVAEEEGGTESSELENESFKNLIEYAVTEVGLNSIITVVLEPSMCDKALWNNSLKVLSECRSVDLSTEQKAKKNVSAVVEWLQFENTDVPLETEVREAAKRIDSRTCSMDDVEDLMDAYPNEARIQWKACRWLADREPFRIKDVKERHKKERKVLTLKKIPERVIQAMERYPNNADVQAFGCAALWHFARDDENKVTFMERDVARITTAALERHQSREDVQTYGCCVIWNLAVNDENGKILRRMDVQKWIFRAMDNHAMNTLVQEKACGAIWCLAYVDDTDVDGDDVLGPEAKKRVIRAMSYHAESANLQDCAISALWNLASPSMDKTYWEMVLHAMDMHADVATVQGSALGYFRSVMFYSDNRDTLMRLDLGSRIVSAMVRHRNEEMLQFKACAVLWILAEHHPFNCWTLQNLGAVEQLQRAADNFSSNTNLKRACQQTIIWILDY